jgi:hypothetical protein
MKMIREWDMVIVPALFVALACWAMSGPRSTTMSMPVDFCKAQYTGRTKNEDVPIQACGAFDQNMMWTAPITTWSTQTRSETRVACDYIEWR